MHRFQAVTVDLGQAAEKKIRILKLSVWQRTHQYLLNDIHHHFFFIEHYFEQGKLFTNFCH